MGKLTKTEIKELQKEIQSDGIQIEPIQFVVP